MKGRKYNDFMCLADWLDGGQELRDLIDLPIIIRTLPKHRR